MKSGSERRVLLVWAAVLATFATAPLFWWVQNNLRPVGGAMAFPKALWLADALVLWIVLPLAIVSDTRVANGVRRAFLILLVLMLLRGTLEAWMLYVTLNWSPWYGIAHDLLCIAALAWQWVRPCAGADALWRTHIAATAMAFVPEIYFAWYMQRYFSTQGAGAVYFVPDDPAHALVLNVTAAAVVCCSVYIIIFLVRWLHAASDRGGARTR